jgi:FkbM family methyltransferase
MKIYHQNHSLIATNHLGKIQIPHDRIIFPHFYHFHSWELELVEFVSESLLNNSTKKINFIDIGAHVGLISRQIQICRPEINFILVEPNASNFSLLKTNITENSIYINRIVSTTNKGEVQLYLDKNNSGNSSTNILSNDYYYVESISLNSIFDNFIIGIGENTIIKLDTEGSDLELFNSLSAENLKKISGIIIEVVKTHPLIIDRFISRLSEFTQFFYNRSNILRKRNAVSKIDFGHLKNLLNSLNLGEEINLFITR